MTAADLLADLQAHGVAIHAAIELLPPSEQPPVVRCPRCGPTAFNDFPIHGGQSVRRDCANCKRFILFPVWYGDSQ